MWSSASCAPALGLTPGNLGQHLSVLEKAQLVHVEKGYEGRRPRTWVNLTPAGEKARRDEIAYLKHLIQRVEESASVVRSLRTSP